MDKLETAPKSSALGKLRCSKDVARVIAQRAELVIGNDEIDAFLPLLFFLGRIALFDPIPFPRDKVNHEFSRLNNPRLVANGTHQCFILLFAANKKSRVTTDRIFT